MLDDFLKVRETLTRTGVASRKDKTLYQSCHILHKQGKYYITHFQKELFDLVGKKSTLVENDIQRIKHNSIITSRLEFNRDSKNKYGRKQQHDFLSQIKVLPLKRKNEWNISLNII